MARLQLQKDLRRRELDRVEDLLVGSARFNNSLFKTADTPERTFRSVDELVTAGNQQFENLDNIDFAGFRNNKELAKKVVEECKTEVAKLHPEGRSEEYKRDLRRVLHARYLQGHGIQVQSHLDDQELAQMRRYFQTQESANNVADAARAINASLERGEQNPQTLLMDAERALFRERGVNEVTFQQKFAGLDLKSLGQVRDFSDSWAVSQSGKYLTAAVGPDPAAMRDQMTMQLLHAQGYEQPELLDPQTALCLLRDRNAEGPRTNATLAEAVNAAVAKGERDYFNLTTKGNQAILKEIGVSQRLLKSLEVSDEELQQAYPDQPPQESRAIRTRVLRDLLRVLPDKERKATLAHLRHSEVNLITAEEVLSKHFGERIRTLTGYTTEYGAMGSMQRANLTSALVRLPEEVRERVFGHRDAGVRERMTQEIESTFKIHIHRTEGQAPNGNENYAPFVKDFTIQGLLDIYNGLNSMSKNGHLPPGLAGTTTISHMVGAPKPKSMMPVPLRSAPPPLAEEKYDRPGSYAFSDGQSGFFGECAANDQGHDQVVLYDDALLGGNGDSAVGLTLGEATVIHELGHAIQLGGTPDTDAASRQRETQLRLAEWSSLSRWQEPDQLLADGRMGSFEYYYDPTVQVQQRQEVATAYGASDPCEDFAEYTPFFFKDPDTAMALSLEKFLYFNQLVGGFYEDDQVKELAASRGWDGERLAAADASMKAKVAASAREAGLAT